MTASAFVETDGLPPVTPEAARAALDRGNCIQRNGNTGEFFERRGNRPISVVTIPSNDSDAGGLDDAWEESHGLDTDVDDSADDPDEDGLNDTAEISAGRNPTVVDQSQRYEQNFDAFPDGTTDLSLDLSEWVVWQADVLATPDQNVETYPRPGDPERWFRVVEKEGPPIYGEDFEGGAEGWTTESTGGAGTDWEIGVPSKVGPATGAGGSANCAGTNLDADYSFNAVATLTSPEIDLTDPHLGGVTLTMQHFPDIEDTFDTGTIRVIRASDGSPVADIAVEIDDDGVPPAGWSEFSANLPDEVLGEVIKLVFELRSDDIQNQAGWYLDNVEVRAR